MSGWHDTFLAMLGLAAAVAGFCALSLAIDRHWEQLHGRADGSKSALASRTRRKLRHAGTVGLLASLAACIALRGSGQGWVAWAGMLTAAAITLVLALTYATRGVVRLGWGATAAALVALAATLVF